MIQHINLNKTQIVYCHKCNKKILEIKASDRPFKPHTLGLNLISFCTSCEQTKLTKIINSSTSSENFLSLS